MDRAILERYLAEGLSLEAIGKREGKHPSTVAHWLKRYGLRPAHPEYGRRSNIADDELRALAEQGITLAAIAKRLGVSQATVRRHLRERGICRRRASRTALALEARQQGLTRFQYECRWHGLTDFLAMPSGRSRCAKCNSEAVLRCRRNRKETLALEAGGACKVCGYDDHLAALEFHHLDPASKEFGIAEAGVTRSLEKCRQEAKKCILLCSNCHAALEAGAITLPLELAADPGPK